MASSPALTLSDYLEKLPGTSFRRLYQQPSTTLAIFRRMLPSLAKTFVRIMLYMDGPLRLDTLDTLTVPNAKRQKDQALSILRALHIVQVTPAVRDKPQEVMLTANFKNSFRVALEGGGGGGGGGGGSGGVGGDQTSSSFGVPSEQPVPPEVDIAFLDKFARRKWEGILHYVVSCVGMTAASTGSTGSLWASTAHGSGSGDGAAGPTSTVKELLLAGQLLKAAPRMPGGVVITQTGFTFLLQAANAQVWTMLLQWLEAVDAEDGRGGAKKSGGVGSVGNVDSVDMLGFLFMLSTLELGRAYNTNALTEPRRNMLPSLMDFGLVYIPPHDPAQYFPTRLATTLTSSSGGGDSGGGGGSSSSNGLRSVKAGFAAATADGAAASGLPGLTEAGRGSIILETNFRVYAFTTSPLQMSVLALFVRLNQRFPGMVAGKMSRESIRRAISFGITSDQIISYLAANAHDQMHRYAAAHHRPVLPPTVVDQIRLWELENERMKTRKGFLFKDFESAKEFDMMAQYADEIGVLVYRNDKKRHFFVTKHEQLVAYLKARRKADQA